MTRLGGQTKKKKKKKVRRKSTKVNRRGWSETRPKKKERPEKDVNEATRSWSLVGRVARGVEGGVGSRKRISLISKENSVKCDTTAVKSSSCVPHETRQKAFALDGSFDFSFAATSSLIKLHLTAGTYTHTHTHTHLLVYTRRSSDTFVRIILYAHDFFFFFPAGCSKPRYILYLLLVSEEMGQNKGLYWETGRVHFQQSFNSEKGEV